MAVYPALFSTNDRNRERGLKTIFSQFLGILVFERQEVLPQFYRRREEFSGIEFELPLPLPETPSKNQEELPNNNINNKLKFSITFDRETVRESGRAS